MNYRSFALAGAMVLSLPAFAQEVTFKVAHFLPSVAPAQQRVLQPWCETLKEESKGRIDCQFYPAMQLGGTPAQLADQVKNGVADVVWTGPGYSTGRFPGIEAFELPFMVKDSTNASKALWQYYEQYDTEEFKDYKVLAFHLDGGQAIHTSKKQVNGLADLAGLKLRTSTRLGAKTLAALGGSPVQMPPAQVTEAIAKGVVDGSLGAWELVFPTKLSEVTTYHSQPAVGEAYPTATILMVLMNKKKYEGLPADLKAIVDKHSGLALSEKFGQVFDEQATNTRAKLGEAAVTNISPAALAEMKKAAAGVEAEWIEQVTAKGLDGKKLAAAARKLAGTE